jgi:hypothetical protein
MFTIAIPSQVRMHESVASAAILDSASRRSVKFMASLGGRSLDGSAAPAESPALLRDTREVEEPVRQANLSRDDVRTLLHRLVEVVERGELPGQGERGGCSSQGSTATPSRGDGGAFGEYGRTKEEERAGVTGKAGVGRSSDKQAGASLGAGERPSSWWGLFSCFS